MVEGRGRMKHKCRMHPISEQAHRACHTAVVRSQIERATCTFVVFIPQHGGAHAAQGSRVGVSVVRV